MALRLTGSQMYQLNQALVARFEEISGAGLSYRQTATLLGEGLGFFVSENHVRYAIKITGLSWSARREPSPRKKRERRSSDLLEMLIRSHVRLCRELGVAAPPGLVEYVEERARQREARESSPPQAPACEHDWQGIQSIPGSGRRCSKCGLTQCD